MNDNDRWNLIFILFSGIPIYRKEEKMRISDSPSWAIVLFLICALMNPLCVKIWSILCRSTKTNPPPKKKHIFERKICMLFVRFVSHCHNPIFCCVCFTICSQVRCVSQPYSILTVRMFYDISSDVRIEWDIRIPAEPFEGLDESTLCNTWSLIRHPPSRNHSRTHAKSLRRGWRYAILRNFNSVSPWLLFMS